MTWQYVAWIDPVMKCVVCFIMFLHVSFIFVRVFQCTGIKHIKHMFFDVFVCSFFYKIYMDSS